MTFEKAAAVAGMYGEEDKTLFIVDAEPVPEGPNEEDCTSYGGGTRGGCCRHHGGGR